MYVITNHQDSTYYLLLLWTEFSLPFCALEREKDTLKIAMATFNLKNRIYVEVSKCGTKPFHDGRIHYETNMACVFYGTKINLPSPHPLEIKRERETHD